MCEASVPYPGLFVEVPLEVLEVVVVALAVVPRGVEFRFQLFFQRSPPRRGGLVRFL